MFFSYLDINECLSNNGNCSQVCTNTNGSYYCSCYPGYLLQPDGKTCTGALYLELHKCVFEHLYFFLPPHSPPADINECAVQNGNCSQLCVNTNGSYYCSCYPGYRLNQDNKTCDGTCVGPCLSGRGSP